VNDSYLRSDEIFVLGAGFTKAFYPDSPLMIDDFQGDYLLKKFEAFPQASHIMEAELNRNNGLINIENLMTRLEGLMPYDFDREADEELSMLSVELRKAFLKRIREARKKGGKDDYLKALAKYCIDKHIHCVTFNYDDIWDEAIYQQGNHQFWDPEGGYGFFCKASLSTVVDGRFATYIDTKLAMLLLKLHGSINWFPRRGHSKPYSVDAITHHEEWVKYDTKARTETIQHHIEPEPFIVPPILTKSSIVEQPILRLLWYLAYQVLSKTSKVTFIGYSCPTTDIAARVLFQESLESLSTNDVNVVNLAGTNKERNDILRSYECVFHGIPPKNFYFDGALEWSRELVSSSKKAKTK
jgi:hypothetical protein